MDKLVFSCCLCGEELSEDDPEAAQIVVIAKWFGPKESWREQYWWLHRKPCWEAAMQPPYREFAPLDEEED